jgi:hypothetical protein
LLEVDHAAGFAVHGVRAQAAVEELRQHGAVRFDELAVDARDVDLPQIDARARMGTCPCHDIQQPRPHVGQCERPQGGLPQPRQQCRLGGPRLRDK